MQKYVIIEGLDRCGKDTQIGLLQRRYFPEVWQVFHYSKVPFIEKNHHKEYSELLYSDMFNMMVDSLGNERNLIFNRSHLGEAVYAPLYRDYDGDYVFEIEENWLKKTKGLLSERIFMITLVNEPSILIARDDGEGFSKNENDIKVEKERFERAHWKSSIKNKILINCGTQSIEDIHQIIYTFIETANLPIL